MHGRPNASTGWPPIVVGRQRDCAAAGSIVAMMPQQTSPQSKAKLNLELFRSKARG
jgi:hypothetical protein